MWCIFPARVRSTTGRYCFHRCLSVHRGQSADSARGGESSWGGGQSSRRGSVQGGSVQPGGVSQPGGGSAKIGQQNEYLLHSGRYASCVHAGGLSCKYIISIVKTKTAQQLHRDEAFNSETGGVMPNQWYIWAISVLIFFSKLKECNHYR